MSSTRDMLCLKKTARVCPISRQLGVQAVRREILAHDSNSGVSGIAAAKSPRGGM